MMMVVVEVVVAVVARGNKTRLKTFLLEKRKDPRDEARGGLWGYPPQTVSGISANKSLVPNE